jgi:hypothetical protein
VYFVAVLVHRTDVHGVRQGRCPALEHLLREPQDKSVNITNNDNNVNVIMNLLIYSDFVLTFKGKISRYIVRSRDAKASSTCHKTKQNKTKQNNLCVEIAKASGISAFVRTIEMANVVNDYPLPPALRRSDLCTRADTAQQSPTTLQMAASAPVQAIKMTVRILITRQIEEDSDGFAADSGSIHDVINHVINHVINGPI